MTSKFQIANATSGADLGIYEGADEQAALDAMAQDAGYNSFRDSALIARIGDEAPEEIEAMVESARADLVVEEVR